MNGWSLSGSMKANNHWQSGNKGTRMCLLRRGSDNSLIGLTKYYAMYYGYVGILFNVTQNDCLPKGNGFYSSSVDKPYATNILTLEHGVINYFEISFSNIIIPSYMNGITWYLKNITLSDARLPNLLSYGIKDFKSNREIVKNKTFPPVSEMHIYKKDPIVNLKDYSDGIIEQVDVNEVIFSDGLEIYVKLDATSKNQDEKLVMFPTDINLDYIYNESTDFSSFPYETGKRVYIGYWLSEMEEINNLFEIGQANFSDEQKERFEYLTGFYVTVNFKKISEDKYNAQKYSTTN